MISIFFSVNRLHNPFNMFQKLYLREKYFLSFISSFAGLGNSYPWLFYYTPKFFWKYHKVKDGLLFIPSINNVCRVESSAREMGRKIIKCWLWFFCGGIYFRFVLFLFCINGYKEMVWSDFLHSSTKINIFVVYTGKLSYFVYHKYLIDYREKFNVNEYLIILNGS